MTDQVDRVGLAVFPHMGERRKAAIANQLEVNHQRRELSQGTNRSMLDGA